jgi:hypothetical protein
MTFNIPIKQTYTPPVPKIQFQHNNLATTTTPQNTVLFGNIFSEIKSSGPCSSCGYNK